MSEWVYVRGGFPAWELRGVIEGAMTVLAQLQESDLKAIQLARGFLFILVAFGLGPSTRAGRMGQEIKRKGENGLSPEGQPTSHCKRVFSLKNNVRYQHVLVNAHERE